MNGSDLVLRNSKAENTWHEYSHEPNILNTAVSYALLQMLFDLFSAETIPHFIDDIEAQGERPTTSSRRLSIRSGIGMRVL